MGGIMAKWLGSRKYAGGIPGRQHKIS